MSASDHTPDTEDIAIRNATPDDADAMGRVTVASGREAYGVILPDLVRNGRSSEEWAALYRAEFIGAAERGIVCLVADTPRDGVVGFLVGCPEASGDADYTGEILLLYLLPGHQRQGLGRRLLGEGARRLAERGHPSLLIWVFAANAAGRRFYEAVGGAPVREREVEMRGVRVAEVGYGWPDIRALLGDDPTPR